MQFAQLSANKIKLTASLSLKKHRDKTGKFLVEGDKCCDELFRSNLKISYIVISDEHKAKSTYYEYAHSRKIPVYAADETTVKKISDAKTPQGVLCVADIPEPDIDTNKSFIYLESIADPGNLGTIIRTADWFGIENIVLSKDSVDCYNPKVVRSAMGSLFRVNIKYVPDPLEYIRIKFADFPAYAADVNAKAYMHDIEPPRKFGLLFGSEARGFSDETMSNLSSTYRIHGANNAESLNLAVTVGISLYHFTIYKKQP